MDLRDKVCLVTGGTSGIGACTAVALSDRGARVVAVSRDRPRKIPSCLASKSGKSDLEVRFLQGDVADPAACRSFVEQTIQMFGQIDVLVNSAGGAVPGGLYAVTEDAWMNAFAVHVHSVFHLCRAAAPYMAKQGEGAIILVSSAAGLRGCPDALAYGVAKGSLPQFARNLARELADQKIRVNCISPGIIRTPFQSHLTPEQADNNIQNRIPLRREGTPDDVAHLIVSVIENDFVTGQNFVIDGGMSMRMV